MIEKTVRAYTAHYKDGSTKTFHWCDDHNPIGRLNLSQTQCTHITQGEVVMDAPCITCDYTTGTHPWPVAVWNEFPKEEFRVMGNRIKVGDQVKFTIGNSEGMESKVATVTGKRQDGADWVYTIGYQMVLL